MEQTSEKSKQFAKRDRGALCLSVIMKSQPKSSNAKTLSVYLIHSDIPGQLGGMGRVLRLCQRLQQLRDVMRDIVHLKCVSNRLHHINFTTMTGNLLHDVLQFILGEIELVGEIYRPRCGVAVTEVNFRCQVHSAR
jgi:hypothetical protein